MAMAWGAPCDIYEAELQQLRPVSEVVDVRVQQPLETGYWMGDVSLRDLLGASLITYDHHLQQCEDPETHMLKPKAVYVKYQSVDPVTQEQAPVVVPAMLSLDVFADPNLLWQPMPEEEPEEEEVEDQEEEDRRKLKSSIKGDPILLRAKPAPPPDPYFAPLRQEATVAAAAAGTARSLGSSAGGGLGGSPRGKLRTGAAVEGSATMSSFLKASGKDKYSRSRLNELDHILAHSARRELPADLADMLPSIAGALEADTNPNDSLKLTAQMALHIRQMPKLHGRGGPLRRGADPSAEEPGSSGPPTSKGGGGAAGGATSASDGAWEEAPSVAAEGLPAGSPRRRGSQTSSTSGTEHRQVGGGAPLRTPRRGNRSQVLGLTSAKVRLRDLDPHVDLDGAVPTQRLHSNWPDGLRRQIARHFYGMTPAQILEEEEKERLRESRSRAKDGATDTGEATPGDDQLSATGGLLPDAGSPSSSKSRSGWPEGLRKISPERLAAERRLARSLAGSGLMAHSLEVRIKNSDRPGRVVVGRHTERAR